MTQFDKGKGNNSYRLPSYGYVVDIIGYLRAIPDDAGIAELIMRAVSGIPQTNFFV